MDKINKEYLDTNTHDLAANYERSVSNLLFVAQKINEMAKNENVDDLIAICKQLDVYTSIVEKCKAQRDEFEKKIQKLYKGENSNE